MRLVSFDVLDFVDVRDDQFVDDDDQFLDDLRFQLNDKCDEIEFIIVFVEGLGFWKNFIIKMVLDLKVFLEVDKLGVCFVCIVIFIV